MTHLNVGVYTTEHYPGVKEVIQVLRNPSQLDSVSIWYSMVCVRSYDLQCNQLRLK